VKPKHALMWASAVGFCAAVWYAGILTLVAVFG
jgi:hypothetical protein